MAADDYLIVARPDGHGSELYAVGEVAGRVVRVASPWTPEYFDVWEEVERRLGQRTAVAR